MAVKVIDLTGGGMLDVRRAATQHGSAAPTTVDELIRYVKGRVAHYKAPTSVEFREMLARTATGKLQKFKLREQYWKDGRRVN